MKKHLSLDSIAKSIILVGSFCVLLIPLLQWQGVYYFSYFPKVIVFQILVEILFAVWLLLALRNPTFRPNIRNPLFLAVTFFHLLLFVLLPFSGDVQRSLWSTEERMTGIVNIFHYWMWFTVLFSTIQKEQIWKRFFECSLGAASVVSLVGLSQWIGGLSQPIGTLANSTYFSAYLLPHLFLSIILFKQETSSKKRVLIGLAIVLIAVGLFLAGTRATVVALLAAAFLWALLTLFAKTSGRKIKIAISTSLILLLVTFIGSAILLGNPQTKNWSEQYLPWHVNRYVTNLFESDDRIALWTIALEGVKEKPLLGWGWDAYHVVYNQFVQPADRDQALVTQYSDRSHNQFLEMWVNVGLIGLLGYLALWVVLLRMTIKKKQTALALYFVAYLVFVFFSFDTPSSSIILYALFAYTGYQKEHPVVLKNVVVKNVVVSVLLSMTVVGSAIAAVYLLNLRPVQAEVLNTRAYNIILEDPEQGADLYKRSLDIQTYLTDHHRLMLLAGVDDLALAKPEKKEVIKALRELTATELEKSRQVHANDYRIAMYAAQAELKIAGTDQEKILQAETIAREAIALAPHRPEAYQLLGDIALRRDDTPNMIHFFSETILRLPAGAEEAELVFFLAELYATTGDVEHCFEMLTDASLKGYDLSRAASLMYYLSTVIEHPGGFEPYLSQLERVTVAAPDHVDVLASWYRVYEDQDQKLLAEEILKKIKERYPEVYPIVLDKLK